MDLAPPRVIREPLPGGGFTLRSPEALGDYDRCIGDWLERWSDETPEAIAFAERRPDGSWRKLSWRDLRTEVGELAQGLLDLNLPPGAPVVILSDNAIDHALLMLAAMHTGRPACTVSSAYSRMTRDYAKIRAILQALQPGLVYAADEKVYGSAVAACELGKEVPVLFGLEALKKPETPAVMQAFSAITPDEAAKFMLTSGSTGTPKVVINTHRMLCANQQMIRQIWRFLDREKPVLLDWLPWSHTFGGNHNMNMILRNGGTLVIDDGRPAPGLIEKTVSNLREWQPTMHFNVPRGLDMLLPYLEGDEALARRFLERLRMVFYAGAALPQATWDRLQALAQLVRGEPLWLTTSWGSTETSPAATTAHWTLKQAGCIGLPYPGTTLKLVPNGAKLELRVKGLSVFPGYRNAPALTAEAFDEEGFYKIGDAGRLVDENAPERGVLFDGRVAEDFKLTTGTWVSVGTLRVKLVSALAPLAQDAVITGHDRDEVGALVFLSPAGAAMGEAERRAHAAAALQRLAEEGGAASSGCVRRLLLLADPPLADAGEITDKGYVNQRAVLTRRASEVEALYTAGDPRIVRP